MALSSGLSQSQRSVGHHVGVASSTTAQSRRVLSAYVAVIAAYAVYGFAVGAPSTKHPGRSALGFTSAFGLLGVVPTVALLRRHRWAWIVSVLLFGSFVVLYPFKGGRVVVFVLQVAVVALLLSRPMRQHVDIRLGRFANRFARPS